LDSGLTSAILDHLALHGVKPGPGETDHRPLPQLDQVELATATLFDSTVSLLDDSQLEDSLEEMLWSQTSIFHRRLTHLQRRLDGNEFEVRESIAVQDGSEVACVELERLQMIGLKLWTTATLLSRCAIWLATISQPLPDHPGCPVPDRRFHTDVCHLQWWTVGPFCQPNAAKSSKYIGQKAPASPSRVEIIKLIISSGPSLMPCIKNIQTWFCCTVARPKVPK
jgi:hypothetical protein